MEKIEYSNGGYDVTSRVGNEIFVCYGNDGVFGLAYVFLSSILIGYFTYEKCVGSDALELLALLFLYTAVILGGYITTRLAVSVIFSKSGCGIEIISINGVTPYLYTDDPRKDAEIIKGLLKEHIAAVDKKALDEAVQKKLCCEKHNEVRKYL